MADVPQVSRSTKIRALGPRQPEADFRLFQAFAISFRSSGGGRHLRDKTMCCAPGARRDLAVGDRGGRAARNLGSGISIGRQLGRSKQSVASWQDQDEHHEDREIRNGNQIVTEGSDETIIVGNGNDNITVEVPRQSDGRHNDQVSASNTDQGRQRQQHRRLQRSTVGNGDDQVSAGSNDQITAGNGNDSITAGATVR